jgi:hypothetical protein
MAGAGIIGKALKCSKNVRTRKEKGQGKIGRLWVKMCKKQASKQKQAFELLFFFLDF